MIIKNNNAPNPKIIVQVHPQMAPAVKAVARHKAESMVKSTRNFKNIAYSFAAAVENVRRIYNIYNIVHTRARDVKENGVKMWCKSLYCSFLKKIKKISKK